MSVSTEKRAGAAPRRPRLRVRAAHEAPRAAEVAPVRHNPSVRRLLAAIVLVVFIGLVTTDAVACPDGCQAAPSGSAADHCNDTGICLFCTGAVVEAIAPVAMAPMITQLPVPVSFADTVSVCSIGVPDRPPRRA